MEMIKVEMIREFLSEEEKFLGKLHVCISKFWVKIDNFILDMLKEELYKVEEILDEILEETDSSYVMSEAYRCKSELFNRFLHLERLEELIKERV
ncbi:MULTISPECIES: hypothetical protein [Pontibacillus]|uniref:Uncharacterized protein n=1 Tax=Pontibacillus chungwhensis TaxID=265426 RepID=A0ABY8V3U6_9BACI|nr:MULTISPECIES: hypothetical protein [Pontibacillus]MCD5326133.1 hypothetical protein [Pontibacillus sp. HN14]WIG00309.1 hypothetical protein QNI29_20900 [Pontibacillus chungwhensis]